MKRLGIILLGCGFTVLLIPPLAVAVVGIAKTWDGGTWAVPFSAPTKVIIVFAGAALVVAGVFISRHTAKDKSGGKRDVTHGI